jgi:hypothetical protein
MTSEQQIWNDTEESNRSIISDIVAVSAWTAWGKSQELVYEAKFEPGSAQMPSRSAFCASGNTEQDEQS